jgi:hypothetical protein
MYERVMRERKEKDGEVSTKKANSSKVPHSDDIGGLTDEQKMRAFDGLYLCIAIRYLSICLKQCQRAQNN